MPEDEKVFEVLRKAYPSLDEGHFRIMKETRHSLWVEATYDVLLREQMEIY
jgi:hypothetical protein